MGRRALALKRLNPSKRLAIRLVLGGRLLAGRLLFPVAGSEIYFLTHQPRALVDEKIHQPSIFFLPAKIINCLFVLRIH